MVENFTGEQFEQSGLDGQWSHSDGLESSSNFSGEPERDILGIVGDDVNYADVGGNSDKFHRSIDDVDEGFDKAKSSADDAERVTEGLIGEQRIDVKSDESYDYSKEVGSLRPLLDATGGIDYKKVEAQKQYILAPVLEQLNKIEPGILFRLYVKPAENGGFYVDFAGNKDADQYIGLSQMLRGNIAQNSMSEKDSSQLMAVLQSSGVSDRLEGVRSLTVIDDSGEHTAERIGLAGNFYENISGAREYQEIHTGYIFRVGDYNLNIAAEMETKMEEALVGIRIPDGYFNGINWQNIDASRFQWNKESACYKHVEPASEQAFALYIAREALLQDVDPYLVLATVKSSISDHLEPNDFENKFQWTLRALKDFEMDFEGEILQSARESDGFYSADFLARMTDLPMPLDVARVENIFEAYGIFSGKKYELPASYTLRPDHQQNWLDIESAAGEGIRALVPSAHRISSHFGVRRRPQTRGGLGSHNHQGLDISAPGGSSIRCYADGVVVEAQSSVTEGNYVEVDHGNGWRTRYLHCQGFGVEVGDKVKAGDIIASVGSTGRSSGPHLHFEMIHGSTHLNPERFLNRKWSD